ncbi:MAG: tetratricopeptide repeat protein [Myxococcales bacterium]|nr:tetratricopeptide repeat protein [Myxococcales bacterium]
MAWLESLLYRMNIGKVRTLDQATRLVSDGRAREAVALLGGLELKVNIRFRYLYYLVLGAAHLALRQLEAARRCFEEAISVNPRTGSGYFQLAVACARLGAIDDARHALDVAREKGETLETPLPDAAETLYRQLVEFSERDAQAMVSSIVQRVRAEPLEETGDEPLVRLRWLDDVEGESTPTTEERALVWAEIVRERFGGQWRYALPAEESFLVDVEGHEGALIPLCEVERHGSFLAAYQLLERAL